jgi:hypothetical protein
MIVRGQTSHARDRPDASPPEFAAMIAHLRTRQLVWIACAAALLALVGWDFAMATTFLGDDYIFRAYARLESNPLLAFVADKHGGEYYRPIPMLLWWVLERLSGGQAWVFALWSFLLHLLCAALLALAGRALGLARRPAILAGILFFAAPAEREAALWFSASTDLLAVAAILGTLAAFLAGKRWTRALSVLLAAVACFCKETALVLPVLLAAALWFREKGQGRSPTIWRCLPPILPHLAVVVLCFVARVAVLHGVGGTNDPPAPWWAWSIQIVGGVVHALTAYAPLPEWLAWVAGACILAVATVAAWRRNALVGFALVWVFATVLPLPAAGWVVGARYFYLPAAGLVLLAAMALEAANTMVTVGAIVCFLGLGLLSGSHRATEVGMYRQVVAAANAAVTEGLAHGHRIFFIRGGVKDLDLAVKLSSNGPRPQVGYVIFPDVPASFIWLPHELAERLNFVLARPPLPPAGAYRFGDETIVGQARREEAPDLDEVLTRLPELRIIHVDRKGSSFTWEDRTDEYRRIR